MRNKKDVEISKFVKAVNQIPNVRKKLSEPFIDICFLPVLVTKQYKPETASNPRFSLPHHPLQKL